MMTSPKEIKELKSSINICTALIVCLLAVTLGLVIGYFSLPWVAVKLPFIDRSQMCICKDKVHPFPPTPGPPPIPPYEPEEPRNITDGCEYECYGDM